MLTEDSLMFDQKRKIIHVDMDAFFAAVEQFAKVQNIYIHRQVYAFSFYCNTQDRAESRT